MEKKRTAGMSMGRTADFTETDAWKNYLNLTDRFCGLREEVYQKAENHEALTLEQLEDLVLKQCYRNIDRELLYRFLYLKVRVSRSTLERRLNDYTDAFTRGYFVGEQGTRYFSPERQRGDFINAMARLVGNHGTNKNIITSFEEIAEAGGWYQSAENHRFYEPLLSLERTGEITINDLRRDEVIFSIAPESVSRFKNTVLKKKTKEAEKGGETKEPLHIVIDEGRIQGEMKIDGLEKGLEAIAEVKKEDEKPRFPHKLPAGTRWEQITIKFVDDENVYIQVKQFKHAANYKKMGFVGKGNNPNPSETWTFLKVLARVNGELTIKNPEARDKYKKQKELLAKSLQGYFSLDYDPFYPYRSSFEKSGNSYKIKITLIPPLTNNEKPNAEEDKDDLGVKDYLDEQAPSVYDE